MEDKIRKVLTELFPENRLEEVSKIIKPENNVELDFDDDNLPSPPSFVQTGKWTPSFEQNEFGDFVIVQVIQHI